MFLYLGEICLNTDSFIMRKILVILSFLLTGFFLYGASGASKDRNNDGEPDQWYEFSSGGNEVVRSDNNFDGVVDYELEYDSSGLKIMESEDFNNDGEMDDFYYYENGVLVRHEVDTNFDSKPDLWVYLDKGVYIERIERDKDFDGVPDIIKKY